MSQKPELNPINQCNRIRNLLKKKKKKTLVGGKEPRTIQILQVIIAEAKNNNLKRPRYVLKRRLKNVAACHKDPGVSLKGG